MQSPLGDGCGLFTTVISAESAEGPYDDLNWLVERTGFEPPRPVDFAAGHHGLNRSTAEDPLGVRADQQPVTWACVSMMKWGIDQALIRRLLLAYEEFLSRRP